MPISTKLGTRHPWVRSIYVCLNEGYHPFPLVDNKEIEKYMDEIYKNLPFQNQGVNEKIAKDQLRNLKIVFSRTIEPISTKLGI